MDKFLVRLLCVACAPGRCVPTRDGPRYMSPRILLCVLVKTPVDLRFCGCGYWFFEF